MREARGKKAESAAAQLAEGTEEELWLLEVMNDLEVAEAAQQQSDDPGVRRTRRQANDQAPETEYKKLEYEQFIAGRRIRSDDHGISRNSLAGTELSLVRNFLNRILAVGETPSDGSDPLDAEESGAGLDLGDEISDAQSALESGEEFRSATDADETQEEVERKRAARQRATREQIAEAVKQFRKRIREKAKAGEITSFDVLRLRAILTIVAAAAQPIKVKSGHKPSSLQVLPLDDSAETWPMLMGRVLFTFFGGNHPSIHQVKIEAIHDQLPDDILECWATCFWAIQTCAIAVNSHDKLKQNSQRMISLMQQVYELTGLRGDELNSDLVVTVIEQMNERFADRLGVGGSVIERGHLQIVKENAAPAS